MNPDSELFIPLLVLICSAALVVAAVAMLNAYRALSEVARLKRSLALQETAILSLRGALSAVFAEEFGQGQRQEQIEKRLRDLANRQESLLMRDPETRPYAQAVRMVQKGAGIDAVMENCGLTRGEAELIAALHGKEAGSRTED